MNKWNLNEEEKGAEGAGGGGSTAASTASVAPKEDSTSELFEKEDSAGFSKDFSDLMGDEPGKAPEEPKLKIEEKPAPVLATVTAPVAPAPVAVTEPTVQPPAVLVPPPAVTPVPQVQPTAPITPVEQDTTEKQRERRESYRSELTQKYAALLTEEDKANLVIDPASVLPKMAAEMHMRTVEATIHGVLQMLPKAIQDHIDSAQQAQQNTSEFFGRYKELNTPERRITVANVMRTYLMTNPQADRETVMRDVGGTVMYILGLAAAPPQQQTQQIFQPAPPPPTPGAGITQRTAKPQEGTMASFFEELTAEGPGH